ncbi:hypothetical protein K458DRAFT_295431 [Lentithecium fluviatile CBS 122367]|uniref:Uncharacterized protein n=1 Tax=Lentithecium fluviatile CBS 122367 TaxID=1168545 RepID=A0A6G1JD72_9PLEO|nr:hypothetical protein K458DRAFT_295431 [Lentithecium fluviatile CBS 122367]
MAFLRDLSERVWSYVSPRKTQQRREKPFKVPAIPIKAKPAKDVAMTPQTKIGHWQTKTPGSIGSVDNTLLPPTPPTSAQPHDDLEGDTLIHDSVEEAPKESSDESGWDANEETLVVDDGEFMEQQKSIDREKERVRQEIQGRELREAGWPEDAVFLFQKLGLRGFEPLLPDDWVNDFPSLPVDLFTHNENKAFIKAKAGGDYRAQRALEDLFNLGPYARDAVLTNAPIRTPEYHIGRSVKKYKQWAMKDADLAHIWKNLSLYETVTCDKYTPSYVAEQKMVSKLAKLQDKWNDAFETYEQENINAPNYVPAPEWVPTLYGVIASHTVMALVSYIAPTEVNGQGALRMIAMFDFSQEGYDVWNSLAISIFLIHVRNRMKDLKEFLPEPVIVRSGDPDL